MKIPKIKYQRFTVLGAARSGIAAARLLSSHGYQVFLSDSGPEDKIADEKLEIIKQLNIPYEFGKHSDLVFDCDAIVISPGISQKAEVIKKALEKKIPVVSEIEAAYWFCEGRIAAITGTNGKTTTTTLLGEILKEAGLNVFVSGNIGTAFSDVVINTDPDTITVLEVSSFQLDNIMSFKPDVAILMNITPDHLDRYDNNFSEYINSKFRIVENQDEDCLFVYNYDDDIIKEKLSSVKKPAKAPFSIRRIFSEEVEKSSYLKKDTIYYREKDSESKIIDSKDIIIKGPHNIYNAMAASIAAKFFGVSEKMICSTLTGFKGVEHRIEFVKEIDGVKFYNDSKATNINSVWYALQGFKEPIVLILGGRDKGNDYSQLRAEVMEHVKKIIAIGESGQKVVDYFTGMIPVEKCDDFYDCVNKAFRSAKKGEVVLLSPACASFDMFENYEHRGKEFKRIVEMLNGK